MRAGDLLANRFEIVRRAGSGGMGVVYHARDRETHLDVALKVLVDRAETLTDRFAQEVQLLSVLQHRHIIGYVSHGVTPKGAPYLVMPWLDGEDLQQRLDRGPLSVDETLTLARVTADALAYLHAQGLVHRDLKPSNIFLPNGKLDALKIIDLGIARTTIPARPLTLSGVLLGTPGFMAPEQARGDFEVAPTADIFSLGCVLFECLTGKRLFEGTHVMAILAKILVQDPPRARELRSDVPDGLDLLVHRMVAKDPERRPRDGAELGRWLEDMRQSTTSGESLAPLSLTAAERRVVPVLAVVLTESHQTQSKDETRTEIDPFRAIAGRFGVRAYPLDARTAIVLAREGLSATDQASLLARFGRVVAERFASARIALATGSTLTGASLPVGDAIDRSVTIVRGDISGRGVQVDEASAALITSLFDLRREGGRLILADERASLDPTRPLLGMPTSCVGRDREFSILEATYAECIGGAGPRVVLVTGAAGIGKSRLRHELLRRLEASAAVPPRVLQCRGDPLHATTPYAQIAQAIRQATRVREQDESSVARANLRHHFASLLPGSEGQRVAAFMGELVGVPFDDAELLPLRAARRSAEAMADQIRIAFGQAMRAWCADEPVLLVLEDLHWGDAESIRLLDGALRKLDGAALLVLALARPEVHERFPALLKNRHPTEVRLPPLIPRACARLAREVLGSEMPQAEVEAIVARSEGNAFHLEELIRVMGPTERGSRWARAGEVPETVIAVVQARLERLDPSARKILRAASIFGERFSTEGVSALVGEVPAVVDPILASLVEQEAIAHTEHPRVAGSREFVFRHVLLRGATYATLTDADRALGHRLAAQWLEQVDEDREIVALHWLDANNPARAALSFTEAARARGARMQGEAASRCALRALLVSDSEVETPESLSERLTILCEGLEATRRIDASEAMRGLERQLANAGHEPVLRQPENMVAVAVEHALRTLRSREPVRACKSFAQSASAFAALADFNKADSLLEEAARLAGDDPTLTRAVRHASAKVAFMAGNYGATVELLSTLVLPIDTRETTVLLMYLAIATVAVDGIDGLERGLDYVSRSETLVRGSGVDPVAELQCIKARFLCMYFAGQHGEAAQVAEAGIHAARRGALRYEECAHLHNVGEQYLRLGERERARKALNSSNEIAADLGAEQIRMHNDIRLAYVDGRLDELDRLADAQTGAFLEMHARYWLARLLSDQRSVRARVEFGRALDLARELRIRIFTEDCTQALTATV